MSFRDFTKSILPIPYYSTQDKIYCITNSRDHQIKKVDHKKHLENRINLFEVNFVSEIVELQSSLWPQTMILKKVCFKYF